MSPMFGSEQDVPRGPGRPRGFDNGKALEAAMLLFWERGYEGVSISELTQAMRISTASLYGAFRSKAELYRAVVAYYLDTEGPIWHIPTTGSVAEGMASVFDLVVRVTTRPGRPRGCMVATGFLESGPETRALAAETRDVRDRNLVRLTALVSHGVESGELPPETDPAALARYFKSVMEGLAIQAVDGASVEELEAVARVALDQLRTSTRQHVGIA